MEHPVATAFLVALIVRILAVAVVNLFPAGYFALDDTTYTGMAAAVAEERLHQWDPYTHELYRSTFLFVFPIALLFDVFGVNEWVAQLYVAVLGGLTAALVAALAARMVSRSWGAAAGLLIALLPSQIIWSSLILKDAAVWVVLVALGLAILVANRSQGIILAGIALLIAGLLFGLGHLRDHTMVVASWALVGAAMFGRSAWRLPRLGGALLIAVAVPWLIGTGPAGTTLVTDAGSLQERRIKNAANAQSAFVAAAQEEQEDREAALEQEIASTKGALEQEIASTKGAVDALDRRTAALEARVEKARDTREEAAAERLAKRLAEAREEKRRLEQLLKQRRQRLAGLDDAASGGASSPSGEVEGSLEADLQHLPKGVAVMLFAPYPWQEITSQTMRMAQLEMLVWYPLLGLAAIGLWRARRYLHALAFPILAAGGMLLVYGLVEGNIGTAYRHRGEITWTVVLLAVLGLHYLSERRKRDHR